MERIVSANIPCDCSGGKCGASLEVGGDTGEILWIRQQDDGVPLEMLSVLLPDGVRLYREEASNVGLEQVRSLLSTAHMDGKHTYLGGILNQALHLIIQVLQGSGDPIPLSDAKVVLELAKASPGIATGGASVERFKEWVEREENRR